MTKQEMTADLPNGVKLSVYTEYETVFNTCEAHYKQIDGIDMCCPFCKEDLWGNSLDYEREDGEFKDTYACDDCDVLVTLITPAHKHEYHEVYLSECRYEIEFMWSGEPSTWDGGALSNEQQ